MKPFLLDLVEESSLDNRDRNLLFWSCSIDFRLSPVEVEARLTPPSFDGGLTMWPTAGVPGMVGSLSSSSLVGDDSESLVTATMSLYICSISGVIRPWLMVRLCLARKERRCRDSTRLRDMSSCDMQAFGDVSASGCGRVVLRPVGLVNKVIEDLTVGPKLTAAEWLRKARLSAPRPRCVAVGHGSHAAGLQRAPAGVARSSTRSADGNHLCSAECPRG